MVIVVSFWKLQHQPSAACSSSLGIMGNWEALKRKIWCNNNRECCSLCWEQKRFYTGTTGVRTNKLNVRDLSSFTDICIDAVLYIFTHAKHFIFSRTFQYIIFFLISITYIIFTLLQNHSCSRLQTLYNFILHSKSIIFQSAMYYTIYFWSERVQYWPISVFRPVPMTIPRALPAAMLVPCNVVTQAMGVIY